MIAGNDERSSRGLLEEEERVVVEEDTFCMSIGKEFQRKYLFLNFDHADAFTKSQWHWPCWIFVVYRWLVAAYAVGVICFSIVDFNHSFWIYPWPVWLTNWSYFMLTCHLVASAVISLFGLRDNKFKKRFYLNEPSQIQETEAKLPLYLKLNWFLFVVASAAAVFVTTVYFTTIYPFEGKDKLDLENINLHLMNSVIVLLEFSLSRIPVRLLHFIYVASYCFVYVVFSGIYWSFDNSRVLYPGVLDWNHPGKTFGISVLLGLVVLPFFQFILFACYRLRLYIYRHIYNSTI